MIKKCFIAFAVLVLTSASAAAQGLLPASVQQFLDECLQAQNDTQASRFAPARLIDGNKMVDAFIAVDDERAITLLQAWGVTVNCRFDGFVTAQVPVDRLAEISRLPGVADVEISTRMQFCTDTTLSVTHAAQVLDGRNNGLPLPYDGSGVIVGVIDRGIDFQHRAFKRSDDTTRTRIVRVYNTQVNTGHPFMHTNAYGDETKMPGSVFIDDEIYSLTTDDASGTHGTHTTSIAAGAHVGNYGGMAPGADIVLCTPSVLDGSLSTVEIANCVRYISCYADSVGKPCVISVSVSTPNGQHDGNDYLSKAISQITGPGRIFVIAAGNCGGLSMYAHKLTSKTAPINLMYNCGTSNADSTYNYSRCIADIWVRAENCKPSYQFHILDKTTGQIVWTSDTLNKNLSIDDSALGGYFTHNPAVDTMGYIHTYLSYASYGKKYELETSFYNLVCSEYSTVNGKKQGRYAIGISIWPNRTLPTVVDAWICNSTCGFGTFNGPVTLPNGEEKSNFYSAGSDSCTIGTYAINDSIISAGAYVGRNSYYSMTQNRIITDNSLTVGDIAPFSSFQAAGCGPTGKALPTVCAPGTTVVAAGSRFANFSRNSVNTVAISPDGSPWCVMSGTSMAAPTTAGIIALWLQANPNLSVAQAKEIIAQTAIHDDFTATSAHFGPNGKIDAMAGIIKVIETMPHPLGDANADGIFDISDLSIMIDYLLGKRTSLLIPSVADVNGNGMIDVGDVAGMVDMLLHK